MESILARARALGSAVPADRLEEMRDLLRLAQGAERWAERLVRLEDRYPDAPTLDELDAERSEPREMLESTLEGFRKRLRSLDAAVPLGNPFVMAKYLASRPNASLRPTLLVQEFYYTARDVDSATQDGAIDGLSRIAARDAELYAAARRTLERRIALRRLGTFLAFLLPALAWAARTRRKPADADAAKISAAAGSCSADAVHGAKNATGAPAARAKVSRRLFLTGALLGLAGCGFLLIVAWRGPGSLLLSPGPSVDYIAKTLQPARGRLPLMRQILENSRAAKAPIDRATLKTMGELMGSLEELIESETRLTVLEPGYRRLGAARDRERLRLRRRVEALRPAYQKQCMDYRRLYQGEFSRLFGRAVAVRGKDNHLMFEATGLQQFDNSWPWARWAITGVLDADEAVYEATNPARLLEEVRFDFLLPFSAAGLLTFGLAAWRNRRTFATTAEAPASGGGDAVLGGNFRITRELGRGGMGLVYEALDLTLQRKVAVKQMREELCRSPEELRMFLDEARLVAALKHPNIVEIHGVLREKGQVYLLFEYVAGKTLDQELVERGRLPLREALGLLKPAAEAVDYAHSRRIIHRDLKPSNIMLTEKREVKVMDFGLAHQAKVTVARLTKAAAWGTMAYMAPEQELGAVSKESDIFSLGVCLYEAATGRLPFPGPDYLSQKRERRYTAPSAMGLAPELDAALARALAPEPAERFHSAAELLAAAESCSADAVPGAKTATGAAAGSFPAAKTSSPVRETDT